MSFVFRDGFSVHDENEQPYNWLIEKNSPVSHTNATIREGAYCVLLSGNKHLANNRPVVGTIQEGHCP